MKIRVYFEDTDIGGIVYHTKYINFCERARSEALFKRGILPFNKEEQSGYIVKSLKCEFIKSATLGDILEVKSSLIEIKNVSFTLLQEIYKEKEKIFSMEVKIVYLKNNRPSKIDKELLKKLFNPS